jgi:hypothetical protein
MLVDVAGEQAAPESHPTPYSYSYSRFILIPAILFPRCFRQNPNGHTEQNRSFR